MFRNLGTVDKYGIDGSIAWQIIPRAPALRLRLLSVVEHPRQRRRRRMLAHRPTDYPAISASCPAGSAGTPIFAPTEGTRESGAPVYTFGGRIQGQLGPVEIGIQAKRTGPRYVNDTNQPIRLCTNATGGAAFVNTLDCNAPDASFQVFPAPHAPAYTTRRSRHPRAARLGRPQRRHLLPAQRHQPVRQILCRQLQRRAARTRPCRSCRSARRAPSSARWSCSSARTTASKRGAAARPRRPSFCAGRCLCSGHDQRFPRRAGARRRASRLRALFEVQRRLRRSNRWTARSRSAPIWKMPATGSASAPRSAR